MVGSVMAGSTRCLHVGSCRTAATICWTFPHDGLPLAHGCTFRTVWRQVFELRLCHVDCEEMLDERNAVFERMAADAGKP